MFSYECVVWVNGEFLTPTKKLFVMVLYSKVILYLHLLHSVQSSTQNTVARSAVWEFSYSDDVCIKTRTSSRSFHLTVQNNRVLFSLCAA